jgi:hypothetical protein
VNSNAPAMPLKLPRLEVELEVAEPKDLREPFTLHRSDGSALQF